MALDFQGGGFDGGSSTDPCTSQDGRLLPVGTPESLTDTVTCSCAPGSRSASSTWIPSPLDWKTKWIDFLEWPPTRAYKILAVDGGEDPVLFIYSFFIVPTALCGIFLQPRIVDDDIINDRHQVTAEQRQPRKETREFRLPLTKSSQQSRVRLADVVPPSLVDGDRLFFSRCLV